MSETKPTAPRPPPVPAKGKTRVFIVDDHPMLRLGIKAVINQEPDMVVCGEAGSAQAALPSIEQLQPEVVLVDLSLVDSSGLDLLKDLKIRCPQALTLVLSMHDESFYAERVIKAGAMGFIAKEEGTERVVAGIRKILTGQPYFSERATAQILGRSVNRPGRWPTASPDSLSDRELQVLELIGSGHASGEVAQKLHLSVKTIETHREHIKQKLGLATGFQLVKYAIVWKHHNSRLSNSRLSMQSGSATQAPPPRQTR